MRREDEHPSEPSNFTQRMESCVCLSSVRHIEEHSQKNYEKVFFYSLNYLVGYTLFLTQFPSIPDNY
jgi:hypothetical protein